MEPTKAEPLKTEQMKAMVRHEFGGPEVLRFETVDAPQPGADDIRIRVVAASVNPADRYRMLGTPYLIRTSEGLRGPKRPTIGIDVAGVVDAVGSEVTTFAPGDRVVAASGNGFAELSTVAVGRAARVPDEVSLTDAAALPVAGMTALQGLRRANVESGMRVLVNGAAGGVGHFAVQLAKAAGAHVTGVCSTRNLEFVRSLGADEVVDHTAMDYAELGQRWDVIFDNQGNHRPSINRELLTHDGSWVLIGGPMTSRWVGPMRYIARAYLAMSRSSRSLVQFIADERGDDLATLVDHVAAGRVRPHIERTFALTDLAEAMRHLATQRTRGKLLIEIG